MIDLMSAVQGAVFKALAERVSGIPVLDHVRQGTLPPFVQVGSIESESEGGKDEQAERFGVEIHSVYRGADRSELLAIMHQVREALDGQEIAADGVSFWTPEYLGAAASNAGSDGVTFVGLTSFEIFAEPD